MIVHTRTRRVKFTAGSAEHWWLRRVHVDLHTAHREYSVIHPGERHWKVNVSPAWIYGLYGVNSQTNVFVLVQFWIMSSFFKF